MTKNSSPGASFNSKDLLTIQNYFHELIGGAVDRSWDQVTAKKYLEDNTEKLPHITNELFGQDTQWFSVAGMYGGFAYDLKERDNSPVLEVRSWSRVISGSGRSHTITKNGIKLIAEFDA